jgi:hypothetical protein
MVRKVKVVEEPPKEQIEEIEEIEQMEEGLEKDDSSSDSEIEIKPKKPRKKMVFTEEQLQAKRDRFKLVLAKRQENIEKRKQQKEEDRLKALKELEEKVLVKAKSIVKKKKKELAILDEIVDELPEKVVKVEKPLKLEVPKVKAPRKIIFV